MNGDNKKRKMKLISECIDTHKAKVLSILRTNKVMISLENNCISISRLLTSIEKSLIRNQEEADTKIILHSHQVLKSNETSVITLCSPSGDTDIVMLTVALPYEFWNTFLIDDGSGDNRNVMQLSNIDIRKDLADALIGFLVYSSFFGKGKGKWWKLVEKIKKVPEYIFNSGRKLGS